MAILCATNFSPEALAASTVAAELGHHWGEEVWLTYVMPGASPKAFGDKVFAAAEETLRDEAERMRKLGAKVTPALLVGNLHQELPRFASQNNVSLVIAGDARKEPGFLGLGTLARLAQHLELPVCVVRNTERMVAWARGERPLKVMIGLDQSHATEVAVRWVEKLSKYGSLDVVGGHIFWPPADSQRLGLPLPRTWNDVAPELVRVLQRELEEKLPPSLGQRVRLEAAMGRVSDHLSALAVDERVDLLVVGSHRRTSIGVLFSVSEQCLQSAPVSVAAIPATGLVADEGATLPRIDRVLIATDFSPAGDRAVAYGLGILTPAGTAEIIHVSAARLTSVAEQKITEELRKSIPLEARSRGLTVNVHSLVHPNAAQAIVAAAERYLSKLICLGSPTHSLARRVFGSTALGVFEATHRPVLIVRPPP